MLCSKSQLDNLYTNQHKFIKLEYGMCGYTQKHTNTRQKANSNKIRTQDKLFGIGRKVRYYYIENLLCALMFVCKLV